MWLLASKGPRGSVIFAPFWGQVTKPLFLSRMIVSSAEAGTKVGPDKLGPPVRVGSTRIDSDQLGSNKKVKIK